MQLNQHLCKRYMKEGFIVKVPIQGVSDIITNSSSELFVVKASEVFSILSSNDLEKMFDKIWEESTEKHEQLYSEYQHGNLTNNEFYKMLDELKLDVASGNGAQCDITTLCWHTVSKYIRKCDRTKYDKTHDKFFKIIIDNNRKKSIEFIKENFEVIKQFSI